MHAYGATEEKNPAVHYTDVFLGYTYYFTTAMQTNIKPPGYSYIVVESKPFIYAMGAKNT